jgi:hypothetical protein
LSGFFGEYTTGISWPIVGQPMTKDGVASSQIKSGSYGECTIDVQAAVVLDGLPPGAERSQATWMCGEMPEQQDKGEWRGHFF